MGYSGKLREKLKAQELRRKGFSYNEILEQVDVSKDTLSKWCRDISFSFEQKERLQRRKLKGAEKGRIIGAKRQRERRIRKTTKVVDKAIKELGKLSKRDRFIAGISLYLGDGYKNNKSVGFSNSRPEIIQFMMSWFREFCQVPEEKFRGQIWIHDNMDEVGAKKFWSELTLIPQDLFNKSYIARNKPNSRKIRKNINKYGVFAIRISDSWLQRRIVGWASGLIGTKLL